MGRTGPWVRREPGRACGPGRQQVLAGAGQPGCPRLVDIARGGRWRVFSGRPSCARAPVGAELPDRLAAGRTERPAPQQRGARRPHLRPGLHRPPRSATIAMNFIDPSGILIYLARVERRATWRGSSAQRLPLQPRRALDRARRLHEEMAPSRDKDRAVAAPGCALSVRGNRLICTSMTSASGGVIVIWPSLWRRPRTAVFHARHSAVRQSMPAARARAAICCRSRLAHPPPPRVVVSHGDRHLRRRGLLKPDIPRDPDDSPVGCHRC